MATTEQIRDRTIRAAFEAYMLEGTRPFLYNLKRLSGGEYVSDFTEDAWQIYSRAWREVKGWPYR